MTEETVECFNCGRANPEWAQVCRSCGVALRHGGQPVTPSGPIPTDRDSIVSISAVVGTILLAVILGFIVANINPTEPSVGLGSPSASATESESPSEAPSASASESAAASAPASASPSSSPELPGTVVFGTELDAERQVVDPQETFTPGMTFVHSITTTEPFGQPSIGETVLRINEDGSDGDVIVDSRQNQLSVDPASTTAGFVAGDAANFVRDWGTGLYEMRIFIGETLIARGQFRLSEG